MKEPQDHYFALQVGKGNTFTFNGGELEGRSRLSDFKEPGAPTQGYDGANKNQH